MGRAQIRLLGPVEIWIDGAGPADLRSARIGSLLAVLSLHGDGPLPRGRVAALLWPESTERQARTNLRHLLHTLGRELPQLRDCVEVGPEALLWRPEAREGLDVATFDGLLDRDGDDRAAAVREAVALYRGDLLDGVDDEWLRGERERLRRRYLEALVELAGLAEAAGDTTEALALAERAVRGDPLREDAYRMMIRLRDARGDRTGALRVYHECAATLERELDVAPAEETRRLYRELLAVGPDGADAAGGARAAGPPLVGRRAERAVLVDAWRGAVTGRARFLLVRGEAGIGKTRLVEEFRRWCVRRGAVAADARCYAAEGPLAYGPIVDWLRHRAVRPMLAGLDQVRLTELARLLPELLAETPGLPAPGSLAADEQRLRVFDAVAAVVAATAHPVLLVVDDLPHADRETCQLLHYLLRTRPTARLVVAATARTEDFGTSSAAKELVAGLQALGLLTEFELGPLTPHETAVLAERLIGHRPDDDGGALHRDTEGNPLFVVEALRAGRPGTVGLTPRVQSVIAARLERVGGPADEVLEVAATIGREFGTDVLAAAAELDEEALIAGLDELWRLRIVREQGGSVYDFAHDRIRQVAYAGIGPARRARLHARVAAVLERVHAADPGPVSAQVAEHHERAGAAAEATTWYQVAAEAARALHADARARALLERALAVLATTPASAARDARELTLQAALLSPLIAIEGYTSTGTSAMLARAGELVRALGVDPTPPLVFGFALDALTRQDFATAARHGAALHTSGEQAGQDVLVVEGAYVLGIAAFWQAELEEARRWFELAVARYRPDDRVTHTVEYGQDPKVVCLGRLACTLWLLGRPEQARRAHEQAMAWSVEVAHPFSRLVALTFGALFALESGDEAQLRAITAEFAALAGPGMHAYVAHAYTGYVAVLDGDVEAGMAPIAEAVRRSADAPVAPGQHAMTRRLELAAFLAAGELERARAAAQGLLDLGGPARLWAPLARRTLAELDPVTP